MTSWEEAELARRFSHHLPVTPEAIERHERWRAECKALARALYEHLPPCREQSLALTALEECLMWGNAAIARPLADTPKLSHVPPQ